MSTTLGTPVELDLGGLSIRELRNNAANQYMIVAKSWVSDDNTDPYALYSSDSGPVHARSSASTSRGSTRPLGGGRGCPRLPRHARRPSATPYRQRSADLYGDDTEAKDLTQPEWKKSRTTSFTVTG